MTRSDHPRTQHYTADETNSKTSRGDLVIKDADLDLGWADFNKIMREGAKWRRSIQRTAFGDERMPLQHHRLTRRADALPSHAGLMKTAVQVPECRDTITVPGKCVTCATRRTCMATAPTKREQAVDVPV